MPKTKSTKVVSYTKMKDPAAPKGNKNSYMFYVAEQRPLVKASNPTLRVGPIAKLIGALWRELDDESKAPFVALAAKDKERYTAAKSVYDATPGGIEFNAAKAAAKVVCVAGAAARKKAREEEEAKRAENESEEDEDETESDDEE